MTSKWHLLRPESVTSIVSGSDAWGHQGVLSTGCHTDHPPNNLVSWTLHPAPYGLRLRPACLSDLQAVNSLRSSTAQAFASPGFHSVSTHSCISSLLFLNCHAFIPTEASKITAMRYLDCQRSVPPAQRVLR